MTDYSLDDRWQENRAAWTFTSTQTFSLLLIVIAIVTIVIGYSVVHSSEAVGFIFNVFNDFYANVSSELISIVITVLVLDRLNERRQNAQELRRLTALMNSDENMITKIAVAELRARGWLENNSLKGSHFHEANLKKARLESVVMERCSFFRSNMEGAILSKSNFNQSHFTLTNLRRASMSDTNFQDSSLANADLAFSTIVGCNLRKTNLAGVNLKNAVLLDCQFDEGTILPDETYWTPNANMKWYTDPEHPDFWQPRWARAIED